MTANGIIKSAIKNNLDLTNSLLDSSELLSNIENISRDLVTAFRNGKKVLFCGNGGSAADAQHLAAEFTGRYYFDREPLYAEALHVNTSYMTAVANDYSYDEVFSRLVRAKGKDGDCLIALSTSGNSGNVVRALETANMMNMITIGFTGNGGGRMKKLCKYLISIPSTDTPRIQESHILLGHIMCEYVEKEIFGG